MSDWRDDLPPIPADRIRSDVIREGHRRRQQRRERGLAALYGGLGAVAVALVVVAGLASGPGGDDDDTAGTASPADTQFSGTEAPARTEAAATTGVPEATTADTEAASATTDGAASEATMVPHTTVGGPIAVLPPSEEVRTDLATIWEQPDGGLTCGPSALTVTYIPRTLPMENPVVHWETAGVAGESPMTVGDQVATATVGPFAADTLAPGVVHELLVWVSLGSEVGVAAELRSPTVVLRDCPP